MCKEITLEEQEQLKSDLVRIAALPVEKVIEAMEPEPSMAQCLKDCVAIIETVQMAMCDLGEKTNEVLRQSKRALRKAGV